MDQTRAREIAKDAGEQAGKTVNEAAQRAEAEVFNLHLTRASQWSRT
jgi:hypothetical protein